MKKKLPKICYALALLCLIYCIGVVLTKAAGTKFFLIWLVIAAFFAAWGYGIQTDLISKWPVWLRTGLGAVLCLGVAWFIFIEGLVVSGFGKKGEEGLSYLIVLGAQIKENGPSVALARRLDQACAYLEQNPDTICVVSGGQGSNEPMTEAQGMYDYLVKKGVEPERIIMEDRSRDTKQNMEFSRQLIPAEITKVGIVTSNFHVYRGCRLAKKQGFPDAVGIAATSGLYFLPNNMLREFFGIMKDWVFGNMKLLG